MTGFMNAFWADLCKAKPTKTEKAMTASQDPGYNTFETPLASLDTDLEAQHGSDSRRASTSSTLGNVTTLDSSLSTSGKEGAVDSVRVLSNGEIRSANDRKKKKKCTWWLTAFLLFSEYICPAVLSFPWAFAQLGLVGGITWTLIQAALMYYTSLLVWRFFMRNPDCKNIADIGQMLLGGKRIAWWFTFIMFACNNIFIAGFHVILGSEYISTVTGGQSGICTVAFGGTVAFLSFLPTLFPSYTVLAKAAFFSTFMTFVSIVLVVVFAGIEQHPGGRSIEKYWPAMGTDLTFALWPAPGTSFVLLMNAAMNISYTFIGQVTLPSFIEDMEEPKDFPKALTLCSVAQAVIYTIVGTLVYKFIGSEYITASAFGSLGNEAYIRIAFSFMAPTILFLGVLYISITSHFVFDQMTKGTKHEERQTRTGWLVWILIVGTCWTLAFLVSEIIPFFAELLSLMSSLFDSFFGWIFWGLAWIRMARADYGRDWWRHRGWQTMMTAALNTFIIVFGLFTLTAGTYAAVMGIVEGYRSGGFGGAFSCAPNGVITPSIVKYAHRG